MPLVTAREDVLAVYRQAAAYGWVVPTFCAENTTTIEAVLAGVKAYGERVGQSRLPITIAITNTYSHRSQAVYYTHTRRWDIGLRLFLNDLSILTSTDSPYANLDVMVHLDHVQPDTDVELLQWDLSQFSSIMFDASSLPFDQNIAATRAFVERHGGDVVVEGACDEIADAGGNEVCELTSPERAEWYNRETGVDFLVVNLGTEHRASASQLTYNAELARAIAQRVGPRLVLHGCSSVSADQIRSLFADGVCKVNIWTALERDSSSRLFAEMVRHAAQVAGSCTAQSLAHDDLLGPRADINGQADLGYFTTSYRQQIVFEAMRNIVMDFLALWYTDAGATSRTT